MACKYELVLNECKSLTDEQIKIKYTLNGYEVKCMRFLYKQQIPKQEFLERYFYGDAGGMKYWSKVLGSLKKKGLIYSVVGLQGWIGTEIKV